MTGKSFFIFMLIVVVAGSSIPAAVVADSIYSIGNSLTNDMVPDYVPVLAQDSSIQQLTVDYHIRAGSSMSYMVANPGDVTFFRPLVWNAALISTNQQYAFVTMEPYLGADLSTLTSESNAMAQVVNTTLSGASSHAHFYIYEAWPNQADTAGNYSSYWMQPAIAGLEQTTQTRQFYDRLLDRLNTQFNGVVSFRVVPIGDVFAKIDQLSRAGQLTGLTNISECYRDALHMGDVGRYVAAATLIATIYQRRPSAGLAVSYYQFNQGTARLTTELANQLLDVVWSVVSADDRTRGSTSGSSSSSSLSTSSSSSSATSSAGSSSSSSVETTVSGASSVEILGLLMVLQLIRRMTCKHMWSID